VTDFCGLSVCQLMLEAMPPEAAGGITLSKSQDHQDDWAKR
jgi:hypothetical protein